MTCDTPYCFEFSLCRPCQDAIERLEELERRERDSSRPLVTPFFLNLSRGEVIM